MKVLNWIWNKYFYRWKKGDYNGYSEWWSTENNQIKMKWKLAKLSTKYLWIISQPL